jgi:hypothetical protein
MSKPTYVGVFVDGASRDNLLALVPPAHPNVFADHLTLAFGKAMRDHYPLGKRVELEVMLEARDLKGQAVLVGRRSVSEFIDADQMPHITISCAEGVKPVYSNTLILNTGHYAFIGDRWMGGEMILHGVIDYFPRTL